MRPILIHRRGTFAAHLKCAAQCFLCGLCLIAVCQVEVGAPATAQEPAPAEAVEQDQSAADHLSPDEQREQRRRAYAGLLAVAGIAVAGVALATLVILWGARLRRLNRQPLPTCELQNEHWFLKPPKPPVSATGPESEPTGKPG